MDTVKIKSPVDGSTYAERPIAADQAVNAAVERGRKRRSPSDAAMRWPSSTRCWP